MITDLKKHSDWPTLAVDKAAFVRNLFLKNSYIYPGGGLDSPVFIPYFFLISPVFFLSSPAFKFVKLHKDVFRNLFNWLP